VVDVVDVQTGSMFRSWSEFRAEWRQRQCGVCRGALPAGL